jgi:hypothetical protein
MRAPTLFLRVGNGQAEHWLGECSSAQPIESVREINTAHSQRTLRAFSRFFFAFRSWGKPDQTALMCNASGYATDTDSGSETGWGGQDLT